LSIRLIDQAIRAAARRNSQRPHGFSPQRTFRGCLFFTDAESCRYVLGVEQTSKRLNGVRVDQDNGRDQAREMARDMASDIASVEEATAEDALRVHGEMTIYRAAELSQALFAVIRGRDGDLELDLSQVTEFDTAGLQILLMARQLAAANGGRLEITHPSDCVAEVLQLCNVPAGAGQVAA